LQVHIPWAKPSQLRVITATGKLKACAAQVLIGFIGGTNSHGWQSKHAMTHAYGAHGLLGARTTATGQVIFEMLFDTQVLAAVKQVPASIVVQDSTDGPIQLTFEQQPANENGFLRYLAGAPQSVQPNSTLQVIIMPVVDGEERRCSWASFVPANHAV